MDTAAADREIAQALSVRDAAGLRSGFVRASGVLDGYSFKLEPADKRGFFYVQDTWTKVLVQPRSRFYHILRVRDRSGRELKLHELLCRSDNPLADAFARVVKSRCGSAAATEAIAADLREIASLAAELDRQTAGRTVARVCGRLLALPFFMAYFTVSQFKAVIGMEGAVYKPRLIYPFHLPRVRRLCALIDRFRFTHRCILEEKSGQEHTAWISSGFDIETDPVRTYWGGVKTRLYFFLGDGVADAAGVGRALVWLRPPYDKNIGPENRAVYEAARTYPERLFGLGWTNPRLGRKAALRAIAETFDEYGLLGIKFNGAQDDYVIDDDSVMPFIEKAVSYGKPVAFHIGADGLMPGVMKMFLDPFHQKAPGDRTETIAAADYDHRTTTKWQRYFARDGLARTRSRGGDLSVITTLYGPPAFMTRQKIVRGRDLDPAFRLDCAKYIAAYAKYLRDEEGIPAKYVSVHNEGECWERWPEDGADDEKRRGDDYNMKWTPEQIAEFMPLVRSVLEKNGMADAGVAPGETTFWTRFHTWGIADAIADDPESVGALGLITSHGFWCPSQGRWAGDWRSAGIDIIREKRPGLHAWTTSTSWGKMDVGFLWEFYHQIYGVKVNSIIPWAFIQNHSLWAGGDPNPGCAFVVDGKGGSTVQPGYYYYKQMCRAGQPGMGVARTRTNDTEIAPVAFSRNGTKNPDAFVVLSMGEQNRGTKDVAVEVKGCGYKKFTAFRTSADEQWKELGEFAVKDGAVRCEMPPRSVTSFFGL